MLSASDRHRWTIVLSGGEGERMRGMVERWLGYHKPKQYCSFTGGRSMLEHTWDRAAKLTQAQQILTVIGPGHWPHIESLGRPEIPGHILEQPASRDTGPGIYFPLSYVMAADPDATVALLPSDHFIQPDSTFLEFVDSAFKLAEDFPDRIVLLAAVPDNPNPDYGWIEADGKIIGGAFEARGVRRFREKPNKQEAVLFYRSGLLWNTMVTVAKARTLWSLGKQHLPDIMPKFELFKASIGGPHESKILNWIYGMLKPANFSSSLLQPAASRTVVLKMTGVDWSDWGRPERIVESLHRLQTQPAFPACFAPSAASA